MFAIERNALRAINRSHLYIAILVIGTAAWGQEVKPEWHSILSGEPETFRVQLLSSSENSITVNVQVPGFYTRGVATPRGDAQVVSVPHSVSTANGNLTHVLLVGDIGQIPGYSYTVDNASIMSYNGKGDNPYGQTEGDYIYNDIFIGRFSAYTARQAYIQAAKAIRYERDLTTSDTWGQVGLGVSGTTNSTNGHNNEDDYMHIENIRTKLLDYGYTTVYQDYYQGQASCGCSTWVDDNSRPPLSTACCAPTAVGLALAVRGCTCST
ncbi:MAG: hypothetical protein IKM79_00435 [Bacteroidales bacterium]|nr:hypothetical protein [Bacteroidales bacterium]